MQLCGMFGDVEIGMVLEKPAASLTAGLGASFKCMGSTLNLIFTLVTQ